MDEKVRKLLDELIYEGRRIRDFMIKDDTLVDDEPRYMFSNHANYADYEIWKNGCIQLLRNEFKNNGSNQDFDEVLKENKSKYSPQIMDSLIGILVACSYIPMPRVLMNKITEGSSEGTKIHINNFQSQSQELNVVFLINSIKNELSESQLKDIKQIIEDNKNEKEVKSKLIDKVKSFGSDVATNIIANILTNPAIWHLF